MSLELKQISKVLWKKDRIKRIKSHIGGGKDLRTDRQKRSR